LPEKPNLTVVQRSSCSSRMPPTKPVTPVRKTTAPSNSRRMERSSIAIGGAGGTIEGSATFFFFGGGFD